MDTELKRGRVPTARSRPRLFHVAMTLALIAIVILGFWPTHFGPLLNGGVTVPGVIHLHAVIFSGWMLLVLVQASLVSSGRVRVHRRLGSVGIAFGALGLGVGLIVSVAVPVLHVRAEEWTLDRAAAFLPVPLGAGALFAGFFGGAIGYRGKPDVHRRLIFVATLALAEAAFGRIMRGHESLPVFILVWLSPVFVAMVHDLFTRGRVHPVYYMSAAVVAASIFVRSALMESQGWLRIGRTLLEPFV